MLKPRLILPFLMIVMTTCAFAGQKDNRIHGELTPLRTCFDVTHYTILVDVNPFTKSISGCNMISFKVVDKTSRLQLDFAENMLIDSIEYLSQKLHFTRKKNIVLVDFKSPLNKGSNEMLIVYFSGSPHVAELPPWKGGFVWSKDPEGNDWVGLACEGIGASVWLPCKDHWSDEADSMDMLLAVPENLIGVSNGKLIKQMSAGNGYTSFHWKVCNPINNYNISINVGAYAEIRDTFDGENKLPLTYYVLKGNKAKATQHFKQVHGMLKAFEHYFGAYPFPEDGYKLVETPYWGMEHQSCVAYGNNYKNNAFNFDFIIIHESGHEWFANSITASDPADMWIHESFTTYSEALYVEYHYGKEKATEYLMTQRDKIKGKHPMQGPRNVFYHGQTDNDIYYKGSWMLHTMRSVLDNDSLWFATIRSLSLHFRHKIVTTEEILAYFNTATGRNWDVFFRQYIYHGPLPTLEYKMETGKDGRVVVRYKWKNIVKGFRMPVRIYTRADKSGITWLHPSDKYQVLNLVPGSVFKLADDKFLVNVMRR